MCPLTNFESHEWLTSACFAIADQSPFRIRRAARTCVSRVISLVSMPYASNVLLQPQALYFALMAVFCLTG
mgnify:CR=1 FL=1